MDIGLSSSDSDSDEEGIDEFFMEEEEYAK